MAAAAPAATAAVTAAVKAPRQITNLNQAFTASVTADRRQASAFAATLIGTSVQARAPAR